MHTEALKILVTKETKCDYKNALLMFAYHEEVMSDGRIDGYFVPLASSKNRCMWLEKTEDGKFVCKLFWNETSTKLLIGLAEQIVGLGKGCTLEGTVEFPFMPMVYRNGELGVATAKS